MVPEVKTRPVSASPTPFVKALNGNGHHPVKGKLGAARARRMKFRWPGTSRIFEPAAVPHHYIGRDGALRRPRP